MISSIRSQLTTYDLFALAVVSMLVGHVQTFFFFDALWLRVADRMLVPIFLVAVGYNIGGRIGAGLWIAALAVVIARWQLMGHTLPANFLCTIIVLRLIIAPVTDFMLKSKAHFWLSNAAFILLIWPTDRVLDYGTLGLMMAVAGRLKKDEFHVPKQIVEVKSYFVFVYLVYVLWITLMSTLSLPQIILIAAGAGVTMCLLYDFRQLILNAIARKPKDVIERICHFLGHKSLEIYAIHVILYSLIAVFII